MGANAYAAMKSECLMVKATYGSFIAYFVQRSEGS